MKRIVSLVAILIFPALLWAQNQSANQSITITVNAGIGITSTRLAAGVEGSGYTGTLVASGGVSPYTWSATGLPTGLSLAASTGIVSGTITDNSCTANVPQSTSVVVTVKDSNASTATATLPMNLICKLNIVQPSAAQLLATSGESYSLQLATTGGNGTITWSISAGTLPAGLTLSSTGLISGKPTTVGTASFTVSATDQTSQVAQWHVNLQWGASTTAGVTYNVYRANSATASFGKIANVAALSFVDSAPSRAQSFWYEMTATNANGESVANSPISVLIP